jgi:hypothetical protein
MHATQVQDIQKMWENGKAKPINPIHSTFQQCERWQARQIFYIQGNDARQFSSISSIFVKFKQQVPFHKDFLKRTDQGN